MLRITTPLTDETVATLHAGDRLLLNGIIYTGRDAAHKRLVELIDKGDLGVKSGKGFFDYSDRPLEQVLRERDAAMIKVFEDVKDLIYKRI